MTVVIRKYASLVLNEKALKNDTEPGLTVISSGFNVPCEVTFDDAIVDAVAVDGVMEKLGFSFDPTPPTKSILAKLGGFAIDNAISPPALAGGTVNDYAPAGFEACAVIRQDLSAPTELSGLAGGTLAALDGRVVILINTSKQDLTLLHDDAGSSPENRFELLNQAAVVIVNRGAVVLHYDLAALRWRVIAGLIA